MCVIQVFSVNLPSASHNGLFLYSTPIEKARPVNSSTGHPLKQTLIFSHSKQSKHGTPRTQPGGTSYYVSQSI